MSILKGKNLFGGHVDQFGCDVDKIKQQYYNAYERNNNQANRNFAEYCKNITAKEKAFSCEREVWAIIFQYKKRRML